MTRVKTRTQYHTAEMRRALAFIRQHVAEYGYMPTVRELQAGLGLSSTSLVKRRLDALEAQGYLYRTAGRARAMVLTTKGEAA